MKNNQMKTTRLSSLKKGKIKRIGFFEKLGLIIAGYDGAAASGNRKVVLLDASSARAVSILELSSH